MSIRYPGLPGPCQIASAFVGRSASVAIAARRLVSWPSAGDNAALELERAVEHATVERTPLPIGVDPTTVRVSRQGPSLELRG